MIIKSNAIRKAIKIIDERFHIGMDEDQLYYWVCGYIHALSLHEVIDDRCKDILVKRYFTSNTMMRLKGVDEIFN